MTIEVLDAEHERTEAWQQFDEQQKRIGTLPKGTYDATISEVAVVRRKDDDSHVLRILIHTVALGRDAHAWQGLAVDGDDPFALDESRARALRKFTDRLGIPPGSPSSVVSDLVRMRDNGEVVQVRVSQTPVGQRTVLSREINGSHDVEQE